MQREVSARGTKACTHALWVQPSSLLGIGDCPLEVPESEGCCCTIVVVCWLRAVSMLRHTDTHN